MEYGIIGHKRIMEFFDRAIACGRLSHAYCLLGPEHTGKMAIVRALSAALLGTPAERLVLHTDFTTVARGVDEKTGLHKRDITERQIEALRYTLSQRPFAGAKQIAVVDGAEYLNATSANALLKTLEEPSADTLLFLVAADEEVILPTILSRCQTLYCLPVGEQEVTEGLCGRACATDRAHELASASRGLPGLAITWMAEADAYDAYRAETTRFAGLFGASLADKLSAVEPLFGDKKDHIAGRNRLADALAVWEAALYRMIRNPARDRAVAPQDMVGIADRIREARELLRDNIHPRLLVEQILLAMP